MLKIMIALADHFDVRSEHVEDVRKLIEAESEWYRQQIEDMRHPHRVVRCDLEQKGVQSDAN